MKKFLGILILGLLLDGNTYAENIFECEINSKDSFGSPIYAQLVVKVDNNSSTKLEIKNFDSKLLKGRNLILAEKGYIGSLSVYDSLEFLPSNTYTLYVTSNAKKNDTMYFRGFFSVNDAKGLVHTLTINVWEKNMPIYFFISNKPDKAFKGSCK